MGPKPTLNLTIEDLNLNQVYPDFGLKQCSPNLLGPTFFQTCDDVSAIVANLTSYLLDSPYFYYLDR